MKNNKQIIMQILQAGSLMIEAMAMLGLISMVTPIVYKKAAERTSELQDINEASRLRELSKSLDDYLQDNYSELDASEGVAEIPSGEMDTLKTYFPQGFSSESKMFKDLRFYREVRLENATIIDDEGKERPNPEARKLITGFIVANPKKEGEKPLVSSMRSSRIASMVGANGGYYPGKVGEKDFVNGTQGIWDIEADKLKADGKELGENAVVISSVSTITGGVPTSTQVLHRKDVGPKELNTMETTLHLGSNVIDEIKQLLVTADKLDSNQFALDVDKGGARIKSGNFEVTDAASQTTLGGTLGVTGATELKDSLTVDGATALGKTLDVTGATTLNNTLNVKGASTLEDVVTAGNNVLVKGILGVGGKENVEDVADANFTVTAEGETKTKANLTVEKAAVVQENLYVGGKGEAKDAKPDEYTFSVDKDGNVIADSSLTINADGSYEAITVGGDGFTVTGDGQVKAKKDIEAPEIRASEKLKASTFYAGKASGVAGDSGTSGYNTEITEKLAKFGKGFVEVAGVIGDATLQFKVGEDSLIVDREKKVSAKGHTFIKNTDGTDLLVVGKDDTNKIRVEVTKDAEFAVAGGTQGAVDRDLLTVHNSENNRGLVHVRNGILEVESANINPLDVDGKVSDYGADLGTDVKGYIRADKMISNVAYHNPYNVTDPAYPTTTKEYNYYQVNPAYTSVMHDIKLSTRGGARLSDILPDFINKGIYVMDTNYMQCQDGKPDDSVCKDFDWNTDLTWDKITATECAGSGTCDGNGMRTCKTDDAITSCKVSPWMGFIPAPQCPPGYSRVATITPIRFAMSKAWEVYKDDSSNVYLRGHYDPSYYAWSNGTEQGGFTQVAPADQQVPFSFQTSTWLSTSLKKFMVDNNFYGWSGIMGFIYPYSDYKTYYNSIGGSIDENQNEDSAILWNLFPVYNSELSSIVSVYCYFNRSNFNGADDPNLVDTTYNQLDTGTFRYEGGAAGYSRWDKNTGYNTRLNDKNLGYSDVW